MDKVSKHDERIAKMTFSSVYPHYLTKVEKKGRTKAELHQVIECLTGFDEKKLQKLMEEKGRIHAALATDLNRVADAGIPVDIVFEQGVEVLGL